MTIWKVSGNISGFQKAPTFCTENAQWQIFSKALNLKPSILSVMPFGFIASHTLTEVIIGDHHVKKILIHPFNRVHLLLDMPFESACHLQRFTQT